MILVEEIERLGRAVERQEMTEQEAAHQLLQVAQLTEQSAAEMVRDWRTAVAGYAEFGRLMVQWTAEMAHQERGEGQVQP